MEIKIKNENKNDNKNNGYDIQKIYRFNILYIV